MRTSMRNSSESTQVSSRERFFKAFVFAKKGQDFDISWNTTISNFMQTSRFIFLFHFSVFTLVQVKCRKYTDAILVPKLIKLTIPQSPHPAALGPKVRTHRAK